MADDKTKADAGQAGDDAGTMPADGASRPRVKPKASKPKATKTVHYRMQRAGSTIPKGSETRVSYGAGQIIEAPEGALDHVPGAKAYATAEKAADAGK